MEGGEGGEGEVGGGGREWGNSRGGGTVWVRGGDEEMTCQALQGGEEE